MKKILFDFNLSSLRDINNIKKPVSIFSPVKYVILFSKATENNSIIKILHIVEFFGSIFIKINIDINNIIDAPKKLKLGIIVFFAKSCVSMAFLKFK